MFESFYHKEGSCLYSIIMEGRWLDLVVSGGVMGHVCGESGWNNELSSCNISLNLPVKTIMALTINPPLFHEKCRQSNFI